MRSMQLSVIWANSESQCATADSETPGQRQGQQRRLRPSSALRPPVNCYGSVSHVYCKSEMLWFMSVTEGRKVDQKMHNKYVLCKESLTLPPHRQLHRSDYFLVFFPACVYKQMQRVKPQTCQDVNPRSKMLPRLSDRLWCELTSGPSRPQMSLVEKASIQWSLGDAWVSR